MKNFLLLFFITCLIFNNSFASTHDQDQTNELIKLFNKLGQNKNIEEGDLLEKEIWAIWNKHPNRQSLTKKLEFGTMLMYEGQYDYALEVFTNVIRSDPYWSEAWNKRATLLYFMEDYQKSLSDIDKVLNLEPRHFGALSGRAQIYIKLELYKKALQDLKDARKIHPAIRGLELIKRIENLVNGQNI